MKDLIKFLLVILLVAVVWHVKVLFSPDVNISGPFQVKPVAGYSWEKINSNTGGLGVTFMIDESTQFPYVTDISASGPAAILGIRVNDYLTAINGESLKGMPQVQIMTKMRGNIGSAAMITTWRNGVSKNMTFTRARLESIDNQIRFSEAYNPPKKYFWDNTDVIWQPGVEHPDYHVFAGETKDTWIPLPGYIFATNDPKNLATDWKAGMKHPSMNAYSTVTEGSWIPSLGYKFIMQDGKAVNTRWDAGHRYDNFKIAAGYKEGTFDAYPGYTFVDPEKNLTVAWTPGVINPNDSTQRAGASEGSWEPVPTAYEQTPGDHFGNAVAEGLSGKLLEWLFGDNAVSNKLYEESTKETVKGIVKAIQ